MKEDTQKLLEEANEGRDFRLTEEEVIEYHQALEHAQRKLGVREIQLSEGEF